MIIQVASSCDFITNSAFRLSRRNKRLKLPSSYQSEQEYVDIRMYPYGVLSGMPDWDKRLTDCRYIHRRRQRGSVPR